MRDKLILALDVNDLKQAKEMVKSLDESISYYKVGLELFLNTQGKIIDFLKEQNKKIFLDLKFHDIPNTVGEAARWATNCGVDMFNVHSSGGREMLLRVSDIVSETAEKNNIERPKVIGVTILTSFSNEGIKEVGFNGTTLEMATNLASLTKEGGLDGVVCSPLEANSIKDICGKEFLTVCPGVRPLWASKGDQKRIMTPKDAITKGANYIVVGRPITKSDNPKEAAEKIVAEMEEI